MPAAPPTMPRRCCATTVTASASPIPVSAAAARTIARYVYPGRAAGIGLIEANAYYMDPKARIDEADIARQIEWYKAQGLVDKDVDARAIVDARAFHEVIVDYALASPAFT